MKWKFFSRWGAIFLALFSTYAAPAQTTLTITNTTFGSLFIYYINGLPRPTETLKGGTAYTLNISLDSGHPLFLTADPAMATSSQNFYAVSPGSFSSAAMAGPTASASVVFTPPVSNAVYHLYYVDATLGANNAGTFEIDPAIVFPDGTSTISISRSTVPTNGPAIVTVTPRSGGNIVYTSSSSFVPSVSSGGGTLSGLSPATGTNFTATYTAGANAGSYSISDGLGATVGVSVIKSFTLSNFILSKASGGQPYFTAHGFSNATYQVSVSTNLSSWVNLGSTISSATGFLQFTDTSSPFPAKRFYRLAYP